MARRLKAAGFQIFFDSDEYAMGDDWKIEGKWALKRTSQLILVASPEALSSAAVVREVEVYSSLPKRRIIPIDFDGTIGNRDESKPIFQYLKSEILFIEEDPSCLGAEPSDFIVQKLQDGLNLKRQDKKRSRVFTVVAALLAMLAVAAVAFGIYANQQSTRAIAERDGAWTQQSLFLADTSKEQLAKGDAVTAALLALEGLQDPRATDEPHRIRPYVHGAYVSLESAWRGRREKAVLAGHEGWVFSAVFSPDGTRIVTASEDKTARIWDADTFEVITTLTGHADLVRSAAFSADSSLVVTASDDKTARVWDAKTGKEIAILKGHTGHVWSADFSQDGTHIVTASHDDDIRIWDTNTWKDLYPDNPVSYATPMNSAIFSLDGTKILAASDDWSARILDVESGKEIQKLGGLRTVDGTETRVGHVDLVYDAAYSKDGTRVVTASRDQTARIWDAVTGDLLHTLEGHRDAVWSAAFSPDGTRVFTASQDGTARIWDVNTAKEIQSFTGHESAVRTGAFSPDGKTIVTASHDKTARVWKAAAGEMINTLRGHTNIVHSAVFNHDGTKILTASDDETALVWDTSTGAVNGRLTGLRNSMNAAAFHPDGNSIVTASGNMTAQIWDTDPVSIKHVLSFERAHHWDPVSDAVFSHDGKRVVTASKDMEARVWEAETGEPVWWNAESGNLIKALRGHKGDVNAAAFSPDDTLIVTASHDKTARLWNAATGEEIRAFIGHDAPVRDADFSPDGKIIITASDDGTAHLWETRTGLLIRTFKGHKDKLWSAAFSPKDGGRIITTSQDRTARVWKTSSGEVMQVLQGHAAEVKGAEFNPDESLIVTASADNTARVWDARIMERQELIDQSRSSIHRCLTPRQREQFFLKSVPPPWCIEMRKWPYHTKEWRDWLANTNAGENVEMPLTQVFLADNKGLQNTKTPFQNKTSLVEDGIEIPINQEKPN